MQGVSNPSSGLALLMAGLRWRSAHKSLVVDGIASVSRNPSSRCHSAAIPRRVWLLTVASLMPIAAAVSVSDRSAKYRRTTASHCRLGHDPAVVDDHHVVGGLGDLGQDVTGDQDGPPFGGQTAEQVAQPPDALRVQAVGGLVEDQHGRVAEQGGRQAEPLLHAEGIAAGPLPARVLHAYRG